MRGEGQPIALLDAGGFFGAASLSTSSLEDQIRGDYLLQAMSGLDYDAVNLGGPDTRFGEAFLSGHLAGATFDVVSSNLHRADGSLYTASSTTQTFGDYSVGIVGVMADAYADGVARDSDAAGEPLDVSDASSSAAAAVAEVAGSDLVVLLAFASPADAAALGAALPDVDVVVASADDTPATAATRDGDPWLVRAGYDGKWVVRLDLDEADGAWSERGSGAVEMSEDWPDEPTMAALYQDYLTELAGAAADIVAGIEQEVPVGGSYVGSATCATCHPAQTAHWEGTPHSHAFDTLVQTNHDYSPSCYSCHTVGFGYVGGFLLPDETPDRMDVGCEMCHGAGEEHVAAPGPGWALETTDQCIGCHTEEDSPQFDLEAYLPAVVH
ncbi:MAG: 2',3'-cyclic-nucleotide 2'-phosphodiesterase (5'-nucleotidase family) [Myxococcota bacterium]